MAVQGRIAGSLTAPPRVRIDRCGKEYFPRPFEVAHRSWLETYADDRERPRERSVSARLRAPGGPGPTRRRKIRADANRIAEELDAEEAETAATRLPPNTRRQPAHHGAAEDVATLAGADGFAKDAVWRAADLSHHLEATSSVRLASAIVAMGSRKNDGALRERSMLARSILETDAGQRARFEFLELEGELEAEAAETWWQRRRC